MHLPSLISLTERKSVNLKVLFVRSGNGGSHPITTRQGNSLVKHGVEVEFFDVKGHGISGYLSNVFKLRKKVKDVKPDLIHAHYSLTGIISSLAITGRPIVVSLMGSDVLNVGKLLEFLLKIFIRLWSATIVKSDILFKALNYKEANVIPNGVSFEEFPLLDKDESQKKLNWAGNTKHILFSSDPARPEKNFPLAKEALDILETKGIDFELHYLMDITMEDMALYYNASDVLVMTSLYEGSPNVIKEGMACNCPIVTTNIGDVSKVMKDTNNAYITDFNAEEISHKIEKALFENKTPNGRTNIEYLEINKIAEQIISIYKKVLV